MAEIAIGGVIGGVIGAGKVGRAIFSKRDWKNLQRKVAPWRLFFDTKSPVSISVHLLGIRSDQETAEIGHQQAGQRQEGVRRTFYGWAELTVADASKDGREVRDLPEWWHAAIVLPCGEEEKQERERHAVQLAASAVCHPRPQKAAGGGN